MNLQDLESTPPWEWQPDEARTLLLTTLRNENAAAADRRLAAELAGDLVVMNEELADTLIALVNDRLQPDDVRARAAVSLGPVLEQVDLEDTDEGEELPISRATFQRLQESLRRIYTDASAPKEVRRRSLEASVRAPDAWHSDAIRTAFASDDPEWKLTAVFCMCFVKGFDEQIVDALNFKDPEVFYEAIVAAGNWGIQAAWPHVDRVLRSKSTDKPLLLAAIEAVATIRPDDAGEILEDLADSEDEDVVDAVDEALAMARGISENTDWDDGDEDE